MGRISNAHERLLTVALQLLQVKSYGAVGVDAICQKAGVNKGSFYHFFSAKSDLVVAAMERAWDEFRQRILEPSFQPHLPPLQQFRRFFEAVYAQSRQQQLDTGRVCGCLFGSLGCELSGQEELIQQKTEQIMSRIEDYFRRALTEAAAEGRVRIDDLSLTTKAMLAYWQGMQMLAKLTNDAEIFLELSSWPLQWLTIPAAGGKAGSLAVSPAESAPRDLSGKLDFID